jgi:hypothetical protein
MKKILAVVASIGVATLLSGCASQAVKNAVTDIRDSHLAYGSVLKVFPGDSDANKKNCAKNTSAKWTEACGNLSNLVETRIAILNSSRIVTATYMANFWEVQEGSILQVDPKGSGIATKLAARIPRDDCRWTGFSLDDLTSRTGMVKGLRCTVNSGHIRFKQPAPVF